MKILCRIHQMAANDIVALIPAEVLADIKKEDPAPVFRAYVVGHEGVSAGKVVGEGPMVKRWYSSAIQALFDKLRYGLKLFHNHEETNEHEGRKSIGIVVGKALKYITDRLTVIAITYIKPAFRHLPLDVASIEASVRLSSDSGLYEADVDEITGIALGNSAVNQPGFAGATLLAQVQAFAQLKGGGTMELTIDEVLGFVKSNKVKPSDVFKTDELASDAIVEGLIEAERRKAVAEPWARWKKLKEDQEKVETERTAWEKEKGELLAKIKTADVEIAKTKIPALFEEAKKERKLDENQVKFITARLPKFVPQDASKLKEEFTKHLDSEIDEFEKVAESFGFKRKADGEKDQKVDKKGSEPADRSYEIEDKYLDPAQNPMIPRV